MVWAWPSMLDIPKAGLPLCGWLGRQGRAWKTAQAKAYPPALCRIIVQQHVQQAELIATEGYEQDPTGLQEMLQALAFSFDPYLATASCTTMHADFFRAAQPEDIVSTQRGEPNDFEAN